MVAGVCRNVAMARAKDHYGVLTSVAWVVPT